MVVLVFFRTNTLTFLYFQCQQNFQFVLISDGYLAGRSYTETIYIETAEDEWLWAAHTYPVSISNCGYDCGDPQNGIVFSAAYSNFTVTA